MINVWSCNKDTQNFYCSQLVDVFFFIGAMTNNLKSVNNRERKTDIETRINSLDLSRQINLVLTTPWEKRVGLITASEQAGKIVENMPVEELFWTIKATGIEDSSEIFCLATPEQLQFIFDLDWWQKDRLRPEKIAAWLLVLYELAENGLKTWLKWILGRDPWLFPAVLHEFVTVVKRPDEMDIQEARDRLHPFTLDNDYFIGFKKKKLSPLFMRLATTMVEIDPGKYRDILETMLWETPSQNLETAYRLRCGRIGEFGLPDYYESLDIYVPLSIGDMHVIKQSGPQASLPLNYELPAFVPTLYVSGCPALERAVSVLMGQPLMERIVRETTGVANKILMADMVDLDDPEQLEFAIRKSFSMINLGIEGLSINMMKLPEEILQTRYVEEIARFAAGLLLPMGAMARRIKSAKYFDIIPPGLKEAVEASVQRPPELYSEKTGTSRPVRDLSDLKRIRSLLDQASSWSKVAPFLNPSPERWVKAFHWERTNLLSSEELSADRGLLTALINLMVNGRFKISPIDREKLHSLYQRLQGLNEEQIDSLLFELLRSVCPERKNGLSESELEKVIVPRLSGIFRELLTEIGHYTIEPRFVRDILVRI